MLCGRVVSVLPFPFLLSQGLAAAGHSHVALLESADVGHAASRFSFVAADPDAESEAFDPFSERPWELPPESPLASAPKWIGVLPYDGFRDLERPGWTPKDNRKAALIATPRWFRYPAVACFDRWKGEVLVVAQSASLAESFARALKRAERFVPDLQVQLHLADEEPTALHERRIAEARDLILAGDLYQVNLARRLRVQLSKGSSWAVYERLNRVARAPYSAHLDLGDVQVLATSPELLLAAEPRGPTFGALLTEPIKGTRPRGFHAEDDRFQSAELEHDPKERAELSMIVDVERNDLGRVAKVGSVRVTAPPKVVTHPTIHHRMAQIRAFCHPDVSREQVLRAVVPSGSVTGAPKVRAMEVIAKLEAGRRGLYTGGLGFVRHSGGVMLSMAIRTLVFRDGEGEYWTGGGIVADSDPKRELEETKWKALQLLRAVGQGQ